MSDQNRNGRPFRIFGRQIAIADRYNPHCIMVEKQPRDYATKKQARWNMNAVDIPPTNPG